MMTKRNLIFLLLIITFAAISCARVEKWREVHTPADDTCMHCHYTIYKDFKISYRPYNEAAKREDYERVHSRPMSGSDVRMAKSHKEGKGECSECHIKAPSEEQIIISKIGLSFEDTAYQLCGRCHKETFKEWKASGFPGSQVSCMSCHTNPEDEAIADEKGYYHSRRGLKGLGESALIPVIKLNRLKSAVAVTESVLVKDETININLQIANDGVGHNLPTGSTGAVLSVKIELIDSDGKILEVKESKVGDDKGGFIAAGSKASLDITLTAPRAGKYELRITLTRSKRGDDSVKDLLIIQKTVGVLIQ